MKVDNNNIYTSNQNNDFLIIEKNSGEVLKKYLLRKIIFKIYL